MSTGGAEQYIESCGEYTHEYEHGKLVADWESKDRVAKKIVEDFKRRAGPLAGKKLLDAGFGNGAFAAAFAREGAAVAGVEVNPVLLGIAQARLAELGLRADLRVYDGSALPFEDEVFDYVYSTSVLEHVSDARGFLREIERVLVPGGRVYLSYPNRFALKETHTGVWFLSYLPRSVAARVLGRDTIAKINLHFLSYFALLRYLRHTRLAIVPEHQSGTPAKRMVKGLLWAVGLHHSAVLKTIMVVLEKK